MALGHGIGGSLLLHSLQQPTPLDGLILHSPVGAFLDRRWLPRLLHSRSIRDLARKAIAAPKLRSLWCRYLFPIGVETSDAETFFEAYRSCEAFSAMFEWITPGWFNSLGPIHTPTALLWGEGDAVLKPDQLAAFRQIVPGAIERKVPNWNHFPMLESPRDYAETVESLATELLARTP